MPLARLLSTRSSAAIPGHKAVLGEHYQFIGRGHRCLGVAPGHAHFAHSERAIHCLPLVVKMAEAWAADAEDDYSKCFSSFRPPSGPAAKAAAGLNGIGEDIGDMSARHCFMRDSASARRRRATLGKADRAIAMPWPRGHIRLAAMP